MLSTIIWPPISCAVPRSQRPVFQPPTGRSAAVGHSCWLTACWRHVRPAAAPNLPSFGHFGYSARRMGRKGAMIDGVREKKEKRKEGGLGATPVCPVVLQKKKILTCADVPVWAGARAMSMEKIAKKTRQSRQRSFFSFFPVQLQAKFISTARTSKRVAAVSRDSSTAFC